MRCETWTDHEWGARVFVEAGRHPMMGAFTKQLVTCARCGKRTTETEWLTLSAAIGGRDGQEPRAADRAAV